MAIQYAKQILYQVNYINFVHLQHKVTRELVLNFLTNFIPRIGNFVKPYIRDILKICANAFQKDRYSKNKDKNLQIIKQVRKTLMTCIIIKLEIEQR